MGLDRQDPAAARPRHGDSACRVRSSPKVNIIVTTAASAFSLVKVVGQSRIPGLALPKNDVLDAILAVGVSVSLRQPGAHRARREGPQTTIHVKSREPRQQWRRELKNVTPLKPGDVLFSRRYSDLNAAL